MNLRARAGWLLAAGLIVLVAAAVAQVPAIAAGALLHPARRADIAPLPDGCANRVFEGDGVALPGWTCAAVTQRRGTIIYLHGIADNRSSAAGLIARYRPRGFDVIAYDARAHGQSTGDACTYGVYERRDLDRVLTTIPEGPVILIGTSLGAAVALQTATNPRVTAVIAAEVFSDLEVVARERAPRLLPEWAVRRAFSAAGEQGGFDVGDASPRRVAEHVVVPVLLIHGDSDRETSIAHSHRVLEALQGRRALLTVRGAGHNQSLSGDVWKEIDRWIELALGDDREWRRPAKTYLFGNSTVR